MDKLKLPPNRTRLVRWIWPAIILFLVIGLLWIGRQSPVNTRQESTSIKILVSIEPYRSLAAQLIGTELAQEISVELITPPGVEPHDYELTLADRLDLETANIIVINGRDLEPYRDILTLKPAQQLIVAAELLAQPLNQALINDPHLWLDPANLRLVNQELLSALVKLRPDLTNDLTVQGQKLDQALVDLDQSYRSGLAQCTRTRFVTTHQAFAFLAARYQLQQLGLAGLTPESEPTAEELVNLTATIKAGGDQAIFVEPLSTNRAALTLARTLNLQVLTLNPIEALTPEETAAQKDYFDLMRDNLTNLRQGLGCV